ncbi:hypothetical protein F53441_8621 [Fusarium austroafricanum]|uniref:Uncharacterized protein n=1 Tax=Fusarium austroafricanum TaxID=2364996 RepID=A0A8H4NX64_9HYPO|nr:hypothetical protein F53441_8621 [Fusarium austroafricanum]
MKSISYDIDPGGDILLVLKNPNSQQIIPELTFRDSAKVDNSDEYYDNQAYNGRYAIFKNLTPKAEEESASDDAKSKAVQIRVSSRHLTLASSMFRAMSKGALGRGITIAV